MTTITFTYHDREYTARVNIDRYTDREYGSDEDNNRGIARTFIRDVEIEEVRDSRGKLIEPSEEMQGEIRELAEEEG